MSDMERREVCECGGLIVVSANAPDAVIERHVAAHNRTIQHRAHYDDPPEHPAVALHDASAAVSRPNQSGSTFGREVKASGLRPSRGGVSIHPDGYDFDDRRRAPRR